MEFKLNDSFRAIQTDQKFYLARIIEKQGGKKLARPIYEFAYTNRSSANFTCYIEDVRKSLSFLAWEKTNQLPNIKS